MAGRRGCVNSLWSGTERVRIGERLKATLAGVLELEVLRCRHLGMVDAALEDRATAEEAPRAAEEVDEEVEEEEEEGSGTPENAASDGSATSRRQQVSQPGFLHDEIIKYECGDDGDLPTSRSLCGSLDRFHRCLPAWLPGGAWLCRELNTQLSEVVPETIQACRPIILHSKQCVCVCLSLSLSLSLSLCVCVCV